MTAVTESRELAPGPKATLRELDWLTEAIEVNGAGGVHRVHLGPYASRADAEKVAERIRLALGYKPTFVTR